MTFKHHGIGGTREIDSCPRFCGDSGKRSADKLSFHTRLGGRKSKREDEAAHQQNQTS